MAPPPATLVLADVQGGGGTRWLRQLVSTLRPAAPACQHFSISACTCAIPGRLADKPPGEAWRRAEMLTSRPAKPGDMLTSYLSEKLEGFSGTRPRSCIAFIPRVRRSRSSLLSTSR